MNDKRIFMVGIDLGNLMSQGDIENPWEGCHQETEWYERILERACEEYEDTRRSCNVELIAEAVSHEMELEADALDRSEPVHTEAEKLMSKIDELNDVVKFKL